jgi:heterodisulfide reductase subunit C
MSTNLEPQNPDETGEAPAPDPLADVRGMVQACIQCGTCTASCPNEFAMDATPRRLWRMVLVADWESIVSSKTFALCSACYQCSLRCPRGLPLTEAMAALKRIGNRESLPANRSGNLFYRNFIRSVRRHGRVRETEFMTLYFADMKNPLLPLRFAPLGLRLMGKGKIHIQIPSKGSGKLEAIFAKVEAMEG